jgi:hypothetical protein
MSGTRGHLDMQLERHCTHLVRVLYTRLHSYRQDSSVFARILCVFSTLGCIRTDKTLAVLHKSCACYQR